MFILHMADMKLQFFIICIVLTFLKCRSSEQNGNFSVEDDASPSGRILAPIGNLLKSRILKPGSRLFWALINEKHAPTTTDNFLSEYDYIVIGSGPGGSTVAARLSEIPCVKVLLLEAGKVPSVFTEIPGIARLFFGTDIDWKYLTVPQKNTAAGLRNKQVPFPAGKAVGGTSIWNAMLYVRGNKKNFDDWAKGGATGWSYEEVLPYFKKSEENRNPEMVEEDFHGFEGPVTVETPRYSPNIQKALIESAQQLGIEISDINGKNQTGFFIHQTTTRKGQRCSAAKSYLVPADSRSNLHIVAEAFVTRILIEDDIAIGVEFEFRGKKHQVKARKEVILSAGAVNTPQILMLSGIGPRAHLESLQIPVIKDLPVGQNLQDHCATVIVYELSKMIQQFQFKVINPINIGRYLISKSGPLASAEGINSIAFLKNDQNGTAEETQDSDFPDHELYFLEGVPFVARDQTNVLPSFYKAVFQQYENSPMLWCVSQILHPKSKGNITLQSTDPHVHPNIDPNYLADPQDVRDIVDGIKNCNRLASTKPMQQIGTKPITTVFPGCEKFVGDEDAYFTCYAKTFIVTLSHQSGTAKMGSPDDPTVVVDPELRVLGIKGLRVVDASIMPSVTNGNTAAPTYMIGEKAADMIKKTIECTNEQPGISLYDL